MLSSEQLQFRFHLFLPGSSRSAHDSGTFLCWPALHLLCLMCSLVNECGRYMEQVYSAVVATV